MRLMALVLPVLRMLLSASRMEWPRWASMRRLMPLLLVPSMRPAVACIRLPRMLRLPLLAPPRTLLLPLLQLLALQPITTLMLARTMWLLTRRVLLAVPCKLRLPMVVVAEHAGAAGVSAADVAERVDVADGVAGVAATVAAPADAGAVC